MKFPFKSVSIAIAIGIGLGLLAQAKEQVTSSQHPGDYYEPLTSRESRARLHQFVSRPTAAPVLTQTDIIRQSAYVHHVGYQLSASAIEPVARPVSPTQSDPYAVEPSSMSGWNYLHFAEGFVYSNMPYFLVPDSLSANTTTYGSLSGVLEGLNSVIQINQDPDVLGMLSTLVDNMLSKATPVSEKGYDGVTRTHMAWVDALTGPAYTDVLELSLFETATEIVRSAALILNDPTLRDSWGDRARSWVAAVKDMVFDRIFTDRYGSVLPWLKEKNWNPKAAAFGALSAQMFLATQDPFYAGLAKTLGENFRGRLTENGPGWIWDKGTIVIGSDKSPFNGTKDVGNQAGVPDTVSAGLSAKMMVYLYEAGIFFGYEDLARMAGTLTEIMWDGNLTNPTFSNYIDGGQKAYRLSSVPGSNGIVGTGWGLLTRYSQKLTNVLTYYTSYSFNARTPTDSASLIAGRTTENLEASLGNINRWMLVGKTPNPPPVDPEPENPVELTGLVSSITGEAMVAAPGALLTIPLPKDLPSGDLVVKLGGQTVPILQQGTRSIDILVPDDVQIYGAGDLEIYVNDKRFGLGQIQFAAAAPVIFPSPSGLRNEDWVSNGPDAPAIAGTTLRVYTTGLQPPAGWSVVAKIHDVEDIPAQAFGPMEGNPGVQSMEWVIPKDLPTMTTVIQVCAVNNDSGEKICGAAAPLSVSAAPPASNP